jgi:phage gp16-like protein
MTATAKKKPVDARRRALLAKIAIGRKALAWSDELYRDTLESRYGKRSASDLGYGQLVDLVEHLKASGFDDGKGARPKRAGTRPMAGDEVSRKIRSLWLSAWNLGIVRDPSEEALAAWVKRQTKVAALQWLAPHQAAQVIEALKGWLERDGRVHWDAAVNPAKCVALAQLRLLQSRGLYLHRDLGSVGYDLTGVADLAFYDTDVWNRLVMALGKQARQR